MAFVRMKQCPKCGVEHVKVGAYCSRKCANSRGPRSDNFKKTVSEKLSGQKRLKPHGGVMSYCKVAWMNCLICDRLFGTRSRGKGSRTLCSDLCIKECRSRQGRKSASVRVTRSQDEIALYELCQKKFPSTSHNEEIIDGWDADIVIKDLKMAVLWNGPWHRVQMPHKNHSLRQVQTRDRIKTSVLVRNGWEVVVFNDDAYTPESAFEELVRRAGLPPASNLL